MEATMAIEELKSGNKRFVQNVSKGIDMAAERSAVVSGQKPFAIIVSCSDSRVVPEYIFDQGIGKLFVVRVAGNILDNVAMGSVIYAAEHLHTKLIVILGHDSCGAVTATCQCVKENQKAGNEIDSIVSMIAESARKADFDLPRAIEENIRCVVEQVRKNKTLGHLIEKEGVKVVGANYSLSTGEVKFI